MTSTHILHPIDWLEGVMSKK